jgi:hypothetical protein
MGWCCSVGFDVTSLTRMRDATPRYTSGLVSSIKARAMKPDKIPRPLAVISETLAGLWPDTVEQAFAMRPFIPSAPNK